MNISFEDKEIIFTEGICYMCGGQKDLTKHHAIPKTFKPIKNIIMPLCDT